VAWPPPPIDGEPFDETAPLTADATELVPPPALVDSVPIPERPRTASALRETVAVAPSEPRRAGRLVTGVVIGAIFGAIVAAVVTVLLRPSLPSDTAALATAKEAAEERALALQGELAGTQKKAASVQDALDAAQKKLADDDKRLAELKALADQAAKDLTTQKDIAAKAQAQLDQANKGAAADKDAAAKAQAQVTDLQTQLKALGDQLATATKARDDALAQIVQLNSQIKSLQSQLAALPAQTTAPPPATASASTPVPDEPVLTTDQKREVQRALRLLGHYQGEADGGFGSGTLAAIKQFQAFDGVPDTGTLTEDERKTLLDMAQHLSLMLDQPPQSPQGVAASSIKGADARYTRAWNYETGKGVKADPAEAAYWYALAAGDGEAKAFTNLGTLVARGFGASKANPTDAAVLWWAAAVRGEAVAMYDHGVLNERGIGVAANLDLAKAWYQRAAALNDPDARAALKRLGA